MNPNGITSADLLVRCFLPVAGDPETAWVRFRGRPGAWCPGAWLRAGDEGHEGELWLEVEGVLRRAAARMGRPWSSGRTWWRSCSWSPFDPLTAATGVAAFPAMDAELGLDLRPDGRLTVLLDGRVHVPTPPGSRRRQDGGCRQAEVALAVRSARRTTERLLAGCAGALTSDRPGGDLAAEVTAGAPTTRPPRA
jgi:hypothetical protein